MLIEGRKEMESKDYTIRVDAEYVAKLEALALERETTVDALVKEALYQYLESREWSAFDKDVQRLIRENADLMRRLADS